MQLGIKNRLRLISLVPIFILFSLTSYFTIESFLHYQTTQVIQDKLSANKQLNALVGNIARERGMTVMYLGNSSPNTLKSLVKQRSVVDAKSNLYLSSLQNNESLHNHDEDISQCLACINVESISSAIKKIQDIRILVDEHKTNFEDVYENVYGTILRNTVLELEKITIEQTDAEIQELSSHYIAFVRAQESTSSERDLIS